MAAVWSGTTARGWFTGPTWLTARHRGAVNVRHHGRLGPTRRTAETPQDQDQGQVRRLRPRLLFISAGTLAVAATRRTTTSALTKSCGGGPAKHPRIDWIWTPWKNKVRRSLSFWALRSSCCLARPVTLGGRRAKTPPPPLVRSVSDLVRQFGNIRIAVIAPKTTPVPGPHKCGKCGKDNAYAAIMWACPTHGATTFYFQYGEAGNPSQIRTKAGPWVPAFSPEGGWNIKCPTCKTGMMPAESATAGSKPGSD